MNAIINVDSINDASYDLAELLRKKNRDYGDSFEKQYNEYGLASVCIRIEDKLNRLKTALKNGELSVDDETVIDTLQDLSGYALLGMIIEREKGKF